MGAWNLSVISGSGSADAGFDPVLGAPFPPVGYQLTPKAPTDNPSQPRLTWTVPQIIITSQVVIQQSGDLIYIVANNYTGFPAGADDLVLYLWFDGGKSVRGTANSNQGAGFWHYQLYNGQPAFWNALGPGLIGQIYSISILVGGTLDTNPVGTEKLSSNLFTIQ